MDTVDSAQPPIGIESDFVETGESPVRDRGSADEDTGTQSSAAVEADVNELSRRDPLRQSWRRTSKLKHKNSLPNIGRHVTSIVREADCEDEIPTDNSTAENSANSDTQNVAQDPEAAAEDATGSNVDCTEQQEDANAEDEDEEDPDISLGQFVSGSTAQMPVSDVAESTLKALLGLFSDMQQLKQNKPVLMLFLHLLLSRPNSTPGGRESLHPLLFDLLTDDWATKSTSLKTKHVRRAAYEIYSTFLHPQAPLSLSVAMQPAELLANSASLDAASQTVSRLLESGGQDDGTKKHLGVQLAAAQAAVQPAISSLAATAGDWLRARQRDGFDVMSGGDFLPPGCDTAVASLSRGVSVEAQRLLTAKLRPYMLEHLQSLRQQAASSADQLLASCLATILTHNLKVGLADTGASVDSLVSAAAAASADSSSSCDHYQAGQQLFNCQRSNGGGGGGGGVSLVGRQRLSILTGIGVGSRSEKIRFGSHSVELASFDSIRHCSTCKALLCGPGPQGYLCNGECGHAVHRQKECTEKLASLQCKRNSSKSSASIGKSKSFRTKNSSKERDPDAGRKVSTPQFSHRQQPPQLPAQNGSTVGLLAPPSPSIELSSDSETVARTPTTPTTKQRFGLTTIFDDITGGGGGVGGNKRPSSVFYPTSDSSDQAFVDILAPPAISLPAARSEQNVAPLDDDEHPPRTGSFSRELLQAPSSGVAVGRSSSDRDASGDKMAHMRHYSPASEKKDPDAERQQLYQRVNTDENIHNVPSDFGQYIVQHKVESRLRNLRSTYGESNFDRLKDYQLALHEIVFACMSHVRALTVLDLLFVRTWPESCREIMKQLGLHFVPRCIELYKNLLDSIGKPSLNEFLATDKISGFGKRLLAWYSDEQNFLNFKLLSLSFGFSRSSRNNAGSKRSTGNEDDLILRLDSMRRDNSELNRFIQMAEQHEAAQRLDFKAYYSMNMQFTMRMFLLLQTAVKSAKKAKSSCKLAEKDLPDLEKCQEKAKLVVDYSNVTSVRLKELSRQLVLSSTFKSFWVRCKLDKDHVDQVRDQISHLHTCQLVQAREVAMPGFENYRLRLLVFSEFLLIVSETEETKGIVKYQLLRHLGQSMSVGGQGSSEASDPGMGSLRAVSCPPIIPMPNVIHVFEGRQQKSGLSGGRQATEFRLVVDHPSSSRTESLLVVFHVRKDKPRMPFFDRETDTSASEIVESIRKLQAQCKANAPGMDRSGSVNSLGSVISAPSVMGVSNDDSSSAGARDSVLTEEKEDETDQQSSEEQPMPTEPPSPRPPTPPTVAGTDNNPSESADNLSSPSTPVAVDSDSAEASGGPAVDSAKIDSLFDPQIRRVPELRKQLCSVLQLDPDSFDTVAECAQESGQPDTKDGVLIAYKQFEQLLVKLPRLMKAMLPLSEAGAAETLLEQVAVDADRTAKVLRQIGPCAEDSADVDLEVEATSIDASGSVEEPDGCHGGADDQQPAESSYCQEEAVSPISTAETAASPMNAAPPEVDNCRDEPPAAPEVDNCRDEPPAAPEVDNCRDEPPAAPKVDNCRDEPPAAPKVDNCRDEPPAAPEESSSRGEAQDEQHQEQTEIERAEQEEHIDKSLAMTHSDDEAQKTEQSSSISKLEHEMYSLSIELPGPDLVSGEPPLVDGDPDAAPVFGHRQPASELPDALPEPGELDHPD